MSLENLVIIGSGPAGHTAAVYAARAELKPLMFEGLMAAGSPGGQLMTTTEVENFPGFPAGITGPKLMEAMRGQSERFGTRIVTEDVDHLDLGQRPFVVTCGATQTRARAIVLATGASARYLGLPSEKRLHGRGVSACATCDGALPLFRDRPLAVVGGGDSAMEESLFLTRFASRVLLVHRRDSFRASKIMQDRATSHPKIEVLTPYEVAEVLGDGKVSGIALRHRQTGAVRNEEVAGVFVAIGHTPNTSLVDRQLDLDEVGYIKTPKHSTASSVEGVFAAGDVQDPTFRQAITAAGSGCMAAMEAERWLHAQPGH